MVLAMYPHPRVDLSEEVKAIPKCHEIEEQLLNALDAPFTLEPSRVQVSLVDFVSIVMSLANWFRDNKSVLMKGSMEPTLYERVVDVLARAADGNGNRFQEAVSIEVAKVMYGHSRIDRHIMWSKFETEAVPRSMKSRLVLRVGLVAAQEIVCDLRGEKRRAFRCGVPGGESGWSWNEVSRSLLSDDRGGCIPVYAQSHALRQLYERLDIFSDCWPINHCLFESLWNPVVVRLPDGAYLIEGRLLGYKMGHFVAEYLGDKLLITTFLLATMRGTPEANQLRKRLALVRDDVQHLALDRLGTFLASDLKDDPKLVTVLRECGLGHLFDLASIVELSGPLTLGKAADVRTHLALRK
jgi:hypothetical protein